MTKHTLPHAKEPNTPGILGAPTSRFVKRALAIQTKNSLSEEKRPIYKEANP